MNGDLTKMAAGSLVAEYDTGTITREALAEYAEASGDLNPLHLDTAFARRAGFDDVIVHGMLGMALLGRLVTDTFPAERLRNLSARFAGIVPVNQSLHCRAVLEAIDGDHALLALEALNAQGKAVVVGQARVSL